MLTVPCGLIVAFSACVFIYMKRGSASGDEDIDGSFSGKSVAEEVEEEEEADEEQDMSFISSLDNYQLCLKYQQVRFILHGLIN